MTAQRPCRDRSLFAIVLIGLAASGCTATSGGPGGATVTVRQPGTLPTPAAAPQATPRPAGPPPSGTFAGVGRLSNTPSSGCRREVDINGFVVTGDRVRFQGFRGTINPGGFLEMQAGRSFISGSFQGGRFTGSYWQPHPGCTYDIDLNHVG